MQLREGTLLRGGEYRIERVLGQGGFGITYLATDVGLERKVTIKEFFMKEHCNRDAEGTQVSVPSVGSRELVDKFREKFVKEARMIAALEHPNIIPIYSVFEENGTAYYVMKYIAGGSLDDAYRHGRLSESEAVRYVRDVAAALRYCHAPERKILHLDVKPNNILLSDGRAVLIDFGISKHYDRAGQQTSSKPVGMSRGYAPPEQYNDSSDSLSKFSAATDIYALGATLYKLVTGDTPPQAMDIVNDGLPPLPATVSSSVRKAIAQAMQPRRQDRPQSIDAFLEILGEGSVVEENDPDATYVKQKEKDEEELQTTPVNPQSNIRVNIKWLWVAFGLLLGILAIVGIYRCGSEGGGEDPAIPDILSVDTKLIGTINDHDWVDLGLSVKWATCNVGSDSPEDYGDYFAWGETKPKSYYEWSTYKWCNGSYDELTKYCTSSSYGTVDNKTVLEPVDDVATVNMGSSWRMPTYQEMCELKDECTWTWTTLNGVEGYNVKGPNGNSIFLPAAGYRFESSLYRVGALGAYWTSSLYESSPNYALNLFFNSGYHDWGSIDRCFGYTVRAVVREN